MKSSDEIAQARFLQLYGRARERIVNLADQLQREIDAIEGLRGSALQLTIYICSVELALRYGFGPGEEAALAAVLLGRVAAEAGLEDEPAAAAVAGDGRLVN